MRSAKVSMAEVERQLQVAVAELSGMKASGVAALMKRRKVHGRPCTVGFCPLATLMTREYGGRYVVGKNFIGRRAGHDGLVKVRTPDALKEFIQAFDLGRYPDLIAPPPRAFGKKVRKAPSGRKKGAVRHHYAAEAGR